MGKPAARVGDMTAHGGVVTGPGCPTVLIGKMPAAQLTNMHVCPMVTPAPVPVPHVGGPIVGPVPPTVFIGKMPAACVGDMAICVGPPSTILPPGCPTVFLGQAGGGGGGGGAGGAKAAQAAKTLKGKAPKPVKGTETMPIEVQQGIAKAAQYMTPEQVEKLVAQANEALKSKADKEEEEVKKFTIKDAVEILKAIESEEGYEAARFFASHLDYSRLTSMAMDFVTGKDPTDNDPNQMPTRFMLLYGMDDAKLQSADEHPDNFEGQPSHIINIANLRRGLRLLGYKVKETGPYDDEVFRAHIQYLAFQKTQRTLEYDPEPEQNQASQQKTNTGSLTVKLDIDPNDQSAQDDVITLYSTDRRTTYKQVKTIKDDAVKGNNTLELLFTDMDTNLSYTLEADLGGSGKIEYLFRNRKYGKWS